MSMRGSGVDYMTSIFSNPVLYANLSDSSDQDFIGQVVADTGTNDETFKSKIFLIHRNSNLTEENFRVLAGDKNNHVRAALAQHDVIPLDVLDCLLVDENEYVRVQALWNAQASMDAFADAVLRKKYAHESRIGFCSNDFAVKNFEVFNSLWSTVKGSHVRLVENLNYAVQEKHEVIDSKILKVVHDEIRRGNVSKVLKESYALASIALPEILDDWKDDPSRDVINAIARNSSAWVSTHEYLVDTYRRGHVRAFVAQTTDCTTLLNKIHWGTKSRVVLNWVENNPAFTGSSEM